MTSTWTKAFVLLGLVVCGGAAGTAAMSASYEDSRATYNQTTANATSPAVLEMGRDVQAATATPLVTLGFVTVPMGIVGLLGLGLVRSTRRSSGRGRIR